MPKHRPKVATWILWNVDSYRFQMLAGQTTIMYRDAVPIIPKLSNNHLPE